MRRRFITQSESIVPMYIEALEDDFSFSLYYPTGTAKYKINEGEYNTLTSDETVSGINSGDKVFIYGTISTEGGFCNFTFNKRCHIGGDIRSLVYGEGYKDINIVTSELRRIFSGNPNLVSVDKKLLSGITQLKDSIAYVGMFEGCINLSTAPELPISVVPNGCYNYMFNGCESLNYIKMLATDIGGTYGFFEWVDGVAPNGTFVKSSKMTSLPIGVDGIPEGWTIINDDGTAPYVIKMGQNYTSLITDLYNKYGVAGTETEPIPITEEIYLSGFTTTYRYLYGKVTRAWIRSSQNVWLYTEKSLQQHYTAILNWNSADGNVYASGHFYD